MLGDTNRSVPPTLPPSLEAPCAFIECSSTATVSSIGQQSSRSALYLGSNTHRVIAIPCNPIPQANIGSQSLNSEAARCLLIDRKRRSAAIEKKEKKKIKKEKEKGEAKEPETLRLRYDDDVHRSSDHIAK